MTLKPDEFIRRFLIHVLPNGFHRIRHCGLLASGHQTEAFARIRELIAALAACRTAHQPAASRSCRGKLTRRPTRAPCCGGRMNIIETFNRGLDTAIQTAVANRDQDRYVMITFPPHLTDFTKSRSSSPALDPPRRRSCKYAFATSTSPSIFLDYRRFPHLPPTNHARQRRQPTHSSVSVALTHLRRAQTSIALGARGATACHFPRVRSLAAFGRRLRYKPHRCHPPASETLNTTRHCSTQPDCSQRTRFL